jgi:hypothetical protein
MKKTFEVKEICQSCNGTGVYIGIAEKDGTGVVCHKCDGTGCHSFLHEYEEFKKRKINTKIKRIFKANPGIVIGENKKEGFSLTDFGGMDYKDWLKNKPFPEGSEMRKYSCPAWFYQITDYDLKPKWNECRDSLGRSFSNCPHFKTKNTCWERFDLEHKNH